MGKKNFYFIIILLVITFSLTFATRHLQPKGAVDVSFDDFPMQIADWHGKRDIIEDYVIEMLNPQAIFSATYTNPDGVRVHLLFDFFSTEGSMGGPHSPKNCLPGSGWTIFETNELALFSGNRKINAGRFDLRYRESKQIMDFWYVTPYGETSNDYIFKLYELLSSLTFKPKNVAFIRFVTNAEPDGKQTIELFENLFINEIYSRLPFKR